MTQRQKCVSVCWECKDRQSWGWVHCGHKCPIHHTVTKQGREAGECVCVCGWCLMRTDRQSWPTAPENRSFWKNQVGVCVDTDHLRTGLHALWIYFHVGLEPWQRREICVCGQILSTGAKCNICKTLIMSNSGRNTNMLMHLLAMPNRIVPFLIAWGRVLHPLEQVQVHL